MYSRRSRTSGWDTSPVDRISDLPEPVITEILNLVPTRDAVATSLLSKSWRLRWKEVATIDLASVSKFHKKSVPAEIFSFETLKVLKLHGLFRVSCPVPACLPKLTELVLNWVTYEDSTETVGELISSCPVLQSLTIKRSCFYCPYKTFTVSSLSLKFLQICFYSRNPPSNIVVRVDAPALEYLVLHDLVSMNISLTTTSAKEVDLDLRLQTDPSMLLRLLESFRDGVEILNLSLNTMTTLQTATERLSGDFERVTKLVVDCREFKPLVHLIDRCVKLQVLEIYSCESEWFYDDIVDSRHCSRRPTCLSSSLRQVTLKLLAKLTSLDFYSGTIEFFLDRGLVMETVNLCFYHSGDEFNRNELIRRVLGVHKASPNCKILRKIGDSGALELIG